MYSRSSDPVNGRRSGWGTYEGVGVTHDPRAAAPPAPSGTDPQDLERRVEEIVLPEVRTSTAVAGYLFFPEYKAKHHKGDVMEPHWSKDGDSAILRLREK